MSGFDWLQLIFIILKLTDKVDWSWVWVLSPIWIALLINVLLKVLLALLED